MRGSWDDFTGKYGFGDGDQLEDRDFKARDKLIELLNQAPGLQKAKLLAVGYDPQGFHNACVVVILPNPNGLEADTLRDHWLVENIKEADLPDLEIDELPADHPLVAAGLIPDESADVGTLVTLAYDLT